MGLKKMYKQSGNPVMAFIFALNILKQISLPEDKRKAWENINTCCKNILNSSISINSCLSQLEKRGSNHPCLSYCIQNMRHFQFHPSHFSPQSLKLTGQTNTCTDSAMCGMLSQISSKKMQNRNILKKKNPHPAVLSAPDAPHFLELL